MKLLASPRRFQAAHLALALGCALSTLPAQGQAPITKAESTEPDQIRRPGDIDPGRGVTLYAETSLRGANETFGFDVQDLRRTQFGADRARSVRVDRGCVATLYSRAGFRGRSVTLRGDENDLRNTPLGREESASLQVDCRGGGGGGGVGGPVGGPGGWGGPPVVDPRGVQGMTLFTGFRLTGEGMTFDRDVPDLSRTPFGARRARSVGISPGCLGVLYQGTYYRGRSSTFRGDDKDLRNTEVGADTGSSLRVVCGGGGRPGSWDEPAYGVTLYEDGRLSGASQIFDRDVPDLDRTRFGSRRASSVDVSPGCTATLYREPFFRGAYVTVRERDNDLGNTAVGRDGVSSLRVTCPGDEREVPRGGDAPWGGGVRGGQDDPRRGGPLLGTVAGVTLYTGKRLSGSSETFTRDVADLSVTNVGARSAKSIRVPEGCEATVYSEPGFQGRSTTFRGDDKDFGNTPLGVNAAMSIRVTCR